MTEQNEETKALVQMEALDETQIVESLRGRVIERYFYEFKIGERQIVGISWAGIKHIASRLVDKEGNLHPISVVEMKVEETDESYKGLAKAKDLHTGEERWGAAEQLKFLDPENKKRNPFSYTLTVSKAQRNAVKQFIPEVAIQEGYKEWREKQKRPVAEAPPTPPVTRKELEEVIGEEMIFLKIDETEEAFKVIQLTGPPEFAPARQKELGARLANGYGAKYQPGPWGEACWLIVKKPSTTI